MCAAAASGDTIAGSATLRRGFMPWRDLLPGIEVVYAVDAALVHVGQVVRDDVRHAGSGDGEVLAEGYRLVLPAVGQGQPRGQVWQGGLAQVMVDVVGEGLHHPGDLLRGPQQEHRAPAAE